MRKIIGFTFLVMFFCHHLWADGLTQTVRGQVIDQVVQIPLPGANVILLGSDPVVGTTTDGDGYFVLTNVPVGRVDIEVRYMGYHTVTMKNLVVSSAKELVLKVSMEEQAIVGEEIVITADKEKINVLNEVATVSARTFSVEESQRYAGALNDVSRMASNFAGVQSANDQANDIVIRGNSPYGLLWRFEGVDIPNPNHYGQLGATGGPVSMLNNNTLANSDFFTGAFPAEYGNAVSGVFDLNMRNGNYVNHEFMGQIGFNGFELGAEGPLFKGSNSSYLINYRYSVLSFMDKIGLNAGTGTGIPEYQDISFKVSSPIKNVGTFTLFGLGGISEISFENSKLEEDEKQEEDFYTNGNFDIYNKVKTGVLGVSQSFLINPKMYAKATLAFTSMQTITQTDSIIFAGTNQHQVTDVFRDFYGARFKDSRWFGSVYLHRKINQRNNVKVGVIVKNINFDLVDTVYSIQDQRHYTITDDAGNTNLIQAYGNWQHKFNDKLSVYAGLHSQHLTLNDDYSVESRLGLKWKITDRDAFGAGYGYHSQMLPVQTYFQKARDEEYNYYTPNTDLSFMKSQHYVVSYDRTLSSDFRFKSEVYYQYVFDIPVDAAPSSYSMVNTGSFTGEPTDSLVSEGTQRNYGVEFTLEKFLSRGYYFLATTSFFDSKYKGSDGVLRSSAFDGGYVINLLGGTEKVVGGNSSSGKIHKILGDIRLTAAGGRRYTPVDVQASMEQNETVFLSDQAFSAKLKDYFRADIRIAYRNDNRKYAQEFALNIQNVTNRSNPLGKYYDADNGVVATQYQLGIFPMMQYRVEF